MVHQCQGPALQLLWLDRMFHPVGRALHLSHGHAVVSMQAPQYYPAKAAAFPHATVTDWAFHL